MMTVVLMIFVLVGSFTGICIVLLFGSATRHGWGYGKMMSRQLSVLKTLLIRFKGGSNSNLFGGFLRFFIAHFQGLKKFVFRFSQGAGVNGEG